MRRDFHHRLLGACICCACSWTSPYACSDDAQCVDGGTAGYCEPSGYCSFDDAECDSGRRYGGLAPADLAGECTEPIDEATGSDGGGTTGATPPTDSMAPGSAATEATGDQTTAPIDPPSGSESTTAPQETTDVDAGSSSSTGPGEPTCTTVFADDFEDGALDPTWDTWATAGSSYDESGGSMNFAIGPSTDEWVSAGLSREPGPILGGHVRAELVPFDPPLELIGVWLTLYDDACELQIAAESSQIVGHAGDVWFDGVDVDTDASLWLQLRLDLDAVAYWEWSTDGEAWNVAHSEPTPCDMTSVRSALFAGGQHTQEDPITRSVASYERCDPR